MYRRNHEPIRGSAVELSPEFMLDTEAPVHDPRNPACPSDSVTTLDVAYVGSSAANLSRNVNLNQLQAGTLQANPGVNANAVRPYPGYANINWYVTGSNSIYNSLQTQVKRQMPGGALLNVSYTRSRAITDASAYNESPIDSYNR